VTSRVSAAKDTRPAPASPSAARLRLLTLLLRVSGAGLMLAFVAVLLPVDWMAAAHPWLGLGPFPRTPIVDYLTRSVAALYGFHGVFVWLVSRDPVRYRTFVWFAAVMNVLFGAMMLAIDLHAGMPAVWTAIEGPSIVATGIAIAALLREREVGGARSGDDERKGGRHGE
jgi:FtsH-binding integral membrane protein